MAGRILDMGDILTLIEQAEKKMDAEEAEKVASKALAGQLTLADFLSQLQQIKKLGSMKKMLGMIPGAAQLREQIDNFDEREVDRVEAIVRSMTPTEREDVSILNGSRRARIARGSGTTVKRLTSLSSALRLPANDGPNGPDGWGSARHGCSAGARRQGQAEGECP